MATPILAPVAKSPPTLWLSRLHPVPRLVLRWLVIALITLLAFHDTLLNLVETTRAGGLNGFVWLVPVAAVMAAFGVAHRERTQPPIHDRQTDIIVGAMGLSLALMLHGVLMPRYAMYFDLLRLDLLAMWLFVTSAGIVLFGLRPVMRFHWVWFLLGAVFALPYHLAVILLGGSRFAAGFVTLAIASAATGISVGRHTARGWRGNAATWVVGSAVLFVMAAFFPDSSLLAYQMVPALSSIAAVSIATFLIARRGAPKRILDRRIEPLAAREVWAGLALVLSVGVVLALIPLPATANPRPPPRFDDMTFGRPLVAPTGWTVTEQRDYDFVTRLHGSDAVLIRQTMVADAGNPQWDKFARPRTVVVDSTSTWRPFSLNVYSARLLYDLSAARISDPLSVDLGNGVSGFLVTVVDDRLLLTWNVLQFSWRNEGSAQRVLVIAVDNHEPDAYFPEPAGGLGSTLNSLFTLLLRGNAALSDRTPKHKDADLLTTFGRGLVAAQLQHVKEGAV